MKNAKIKTRPVDSPEWKLRTAIARALNPFLNTDPDGFSGQPSDADAVLIYNATKAVIEAIEPLVSLKGSDT